MLQVILLEAEHAPLRDRKASAVEFRKVAAEDPELIAARIAWILAGHYGYGACYKAAQIQAAKRMNREAAICQLVAALEWQCSNQHCREVFKSLSVKQQVALNHAVKTTLDCNKAAVSL